MIEIETKCPLCEKPTGDATFAERICRLCGMGIGGDSHYVIVGGNSYNYFCSSKCVVYYLVTKEVF